MAEGPVVRAGGDTIVFERVVRLAHPDGIPRAARCPDPMGQVLVRVTPAHEVTARRLERGRTFAATVGAVAALLGLAAWGASQL